MKKLLLISIMLLVFSSLAMAATVTRDMPNRIKPNEQLTVTLRATNIDSEGIAMAIEDTIPEGLSISDWDVQGIDDVDYRFENNRPAWAFIPEGTTATITYTINLPNQETTYAFGPLVWFDRSGMSPQGAGTASLLVTSQEETTTTTTTTTTTVEETTTTTIMPPVPPERNYLWLIIVGLIIIGVAVYFKFKKKDY